MENIIKNLNLEGTALQLTYSKYDLDYSLTHFNKKGEFVISIKSIEVNTPDHAVESHIIDVVDNEESALKLVKQFQRAFKKATSVSLRKKGVHLQGYPIWCN